MSIDSTTRIFIDASCLFAATASPNGGSGYILDVCRRGFLQAVVSDSVLREAERNISKKISMGALANFHHMLREIDVEVIGEVSEFELRSVRGIAEPKDDHVLASALSAQTPYLLSMDKRLIVAANKAALSVSAMDAGHFIREILPTHPDYRLFRD